MHVTQLETILGPLEAKEYEANKLKLMSLKEITKSIEVADKKIKAHLLANKVKQTRIGTIVYTMSTQDRGSMNEARLLALLKEKRITHAIKITESTDANEVAIAISLGELTPIELASCKDANIIDVLKITEAKASEMIEDATEVPEVIAETEQAQVTEKKKTF